MFEVTVFSASVLGGGVLLSTAMVLLNRRLSVYLEDKEVRTKKQKYLILAINETNREKSQGVMKWL